MEYTKYKGGTPIHWSWYRGTVNEMYKDLVNKSILPFKGLKGEIIDVGFGDGLVASLLAEQGLKVWGLEPEIDGIKAAKKMGVNTERVFNMTVEKYILGVMQPVDYMFSLNTIEHVDDPSAFLKVMDSVKEFAVVVTDNAIGKDGNRRSMSRHHKKEFSYEELVDLFKDFRTEKVDVNTSSFIGIKIYAHGK